MKLTEEILCSWVYEYSKDEYGDSLKESSIIIDDTDVYKQILENQEKAEKLDEIVKNPPEILFQYAIVNQELEQDNKRLKEDLQYLMKRISGLQEINDELRVKMNV